MPRIEPVPKFSPSTGFEHETKKSSTLCSKITLLRFEHEIFSIAMPRIEPVPKFSPSTGFEHETKKSLITMLRIESTTQKITMLRIEHETFSMLRIEPTKITLLRFKPTILKSPCQESNVSKEIFPAQNRTPN